MLSRVFPLAFVQKSLKDARLDGWLFYYFQGNDPVAENLLTLPRGRLFTRRWFYLVPREGEPVKIVHRIEPDSLAHLPGAAATYLSWRELEQSLAAALAGRRRVAMQYSPRNAVPYISRVDAGIVELVRSLGADVVSSGDLVQAVEAPVTPEQARQHGRTADVLRRIVFEAFTLIRRSLSRRKPLNEYDVQRSILKAFAREGLTAGSPPIVAVNQNSASPHYAPSPRRSRLIRPGDWVLLDIWAKPKAPDAVYADITWCGYAGKTVPEKHERIFGIVREARDQAVALVRRRFEKEGKPLRGWEVDRAARSYIESRGYGKNFIHRTGHSIGLEDHGNGANMDGLETRETRRLLPHTIFSIEPGIYLADFGARSEINVYLDGRRVLVSGGPVQEKVVPILSLRV